MSVAILRELCGAFAPTGREKAVASIVSKRMKDCGLKVRIDALGNVLASVGDHNESRVVFCTHMDQPGWVVEHRDKEGILHLKPVPSNHKLGEGWAVDEANNRYRVFSEDNGGSFRAENLNEGVGEMGTFLAPAKEFEETPHAYFATALSDRGGAALLIEAAEEITKNDGSVAYIFYTGRYLNFTGLTAALEGFDIKRCYVIEAFNSGKENYSAGSGPVLLLRTRRSVAPPTWEKEISAAAEGLGIKLQKGLCLQKVTAADVLARSGIPSVVLGVPLRYGSTRIERMSRADYEDLKKLVTELARSRVLREDNP